MYLGKNKILSLLKEGDLDKRLFIRPLLDEGQIGEISIDLRLGTDFLVSFQGREPYIDVTQDKSVRYINSFFSETRRKLGGTLLLHSNQTILCSSLEFIRLPKNIGLRLAMRSSYSRLGLSISTIVQPGYTGCLSLELTNVNNNPVKVTVGARLFQATLFETTESGNYHSNERKYICQVRPEASSANDDRDLAILRKLDQKDDIIISAAS